MSWHSKSFHNVQHGELRFCRGTGTRRREPHKHDCVHRSKRKDTPPQLPAARRACKDGRKLAWEDEINELYEASMYKGAVGWSWKGSCKSASTSTGLRRQQLPLHVCPAMECGVSIPTSPGGDWPPRRSPSPPLGFSASRVSPSYVNLLRIRQSHMLFYSITWCFLTRLFGMLFYDMIYRQYNKITFLTKISLNEKAKLNIELQRSISINDPNQCPVAEHLINVAENVVIGVLPIKKVRSFLSTNQVMLCQGK